MMVSGKNVTAILIMILTLFLIWVLFFQTAEGDPLNLPSIFNQNFYDFIFVLLFIVLIYIVYWLFRDEVRQSTSFLLRFLLNVFQLLNTCNYCTTIRDVQTAYLVNGKCKNCEQHLCSKCFYISNKYKRVGCPECNGNIFVPNRSLGYPFHSPLSINIIFTKIRERVTRKKMVLDKSENVL